MTGVTPADLVDLQVAVHAELMRRMAPDGEASTGDIANAIKLLAQNGIFVEPDKKVVRSALLANLPEYGAEEKIVPIGTGSKKATAAR